MSPALLLLSLLLMPAGKPKPDSAGSSHGNGAQDAGGIHQMVEDKTMAYSAHVRTAEPLFRIDTGWTTPPNSVDGSMTRNPSVSAGLGLMEMDDGSLNEPTPMSVPPEMYATTMPWTPPTDLPCPPYDDGITTPHIAGAHMRSQSFDMSMPTPMGWGDPCSHDLAGYSQVQTPASMTPTYFPSPATTPSIRPGTSQHKPSPSVANGGSCTCFTVCLQSLQALHNASSPASPPFDLVLSLNRKAVEGCAAMLACTKCMNRSGTHTAAMLLATVMGKITSFYKTASYSYFENGVTGVSHNSSSGSFGVSLGVYQLNGEDGRWLELEILARELRKLEEVYARFREVCADLSDDPAVSRAMIGYLGQNLGTTLEVVSHGKGEVTFA
ncbi:transcription factor [Xylariales sp. AK1849]|nr:transcription factor [Xylariales sp. AK1849]